MLITATVIYLAIGAILAALTLVDEFAETPHVGKARLLWLAYGVALIPGWLPIIAVRWQAAK